LCALCPMETNIRNGIESLEIEDSADIDTDPIASSSGVVHLTPPPEERDKWLESEITVTKIEEDDSE
ncbi:unnamed protein product, partial [Allacma fusca]